MQNITPFLWFNGQAEEAARFYVSVFKNSRIVTTNYYLEGSPGTPGTVMTVQFVLDGLQFVALQRRAGIQVLARGFVRGQLPDSRGDRQAVARTLRGRARD